MSGKINLILGFHAHIVPSAPDDTFEELYETRIKPFITVLNHYPKIPAAVHFSGFLLSRLEQKKPELFLLVKDMVARKQLELLGGGFYEPLVPLIPPSDRIGQIEMLTTYIRQNFGRRPQGCLLPCSGWEQSLAGTLAACGMGYTFLSEEQFAAAGAAEGSLLTPVLTEDQGKLLLVFPVFSSLSGMGTLGAAAALKKQGWYKNDVQGLVTVFPEFPSKNAEEAMRAFFEELSAEAADKNGAVELSTPGKVYRSAAFLPRLYFSPSGDASCARPRSCLTRSPEINGLYAKVYFVHNAINQLRGDKPRKRGAREELWKAQGCETFIQGNDREVRRYADKAILAAERILREKDFKPSLLVFDFDMDRTEEYLFQDKNINCYVRTRGASVFELDYLPKGWNYLDSFSGASERRAAFSDLLLPGDFVPPSDPVAAVYTASGAEGGVSFPPTGRFCGTEEYRLVSAERVKLKASFVLAPKKGLPFGAVEIRKTYSLEKNVLNLSYALSNRGDEKLILCFAPRFDLALAGSKILFRKSQGEEETSPGTSGVFRRVLSLEEQDSKHGASLGVTFQTPCDLYCADIETYCQTRCFLPLFQLFLNPGDTWENRLSLSVSAKARKNP